jgi:hypothetical protein
MRHHSKDIGVAVLAKDFKGAIAMLGGITVFDTGHASPWVSLGFSDLLTADHALQQEADQLSK